MGDVNKDGIKVYDKRDVGDWWGGGEGARLEKKKLQIFEVSPTLKTTDTAL